MARSGDSPWLQSFSAALVGIVLVFAGFAALGCWLTALGEGTVWQSVGTGIATLICFVVGFSLLVIAVKRRGGLLRARPTQQQRRTYRAQYRHRTEHSEPLLPPSPPNPSPTRNMCLDATIVGMTVWNEPDREGAAQVRAEQDSQVVVVTGASAGIGRAAARAFGARGAQVALLARGEVGLQAAARDVEAAGGTAMVVPTDVADAQQVEESAAAVESRLGPIDVWVNVAFTSVFAPFGEIGADEYKRVTEVNYLGFVYATMAALRRMRARDAGTIVQVGSALAYRGIPLQTAYCGSKHAIQGFHEALRCELLHDHSNVHVTMVQKIGRAHV